MPNRDWKLRIEDILWETISNDLPPLIPLLKAILSEQNESGPPDANR